MTMVLRPSWVEVDLGRIKHNLRQLQQLAPGASVLAVVKADGYGHGAVEASQALLQAGAGALGVATPEEAVHLREKGIVAPILVLGPLFPGQEETFACHDLIATAADDTSLAALGRAAAERGTQAKIHLKVDTGMGRLGVLGSDAMDLAETAANVPGLLVHGVYSHLATSDENPSYAEHQIKEYDAVCAGLTQRGLMPEIRHIANSAAILRQMGTGYEWVRAGLALYGLYPDSRLRSRANLLPALAWKAKIVSAKRVPAGSGVSYGLTYVTECDTTLVIVPVGYADGFRRGLSNRGRVLIGGRSYPVSGRVCMDQIVVDVGDAPVEVGDEVVLIGSQGNETVTADDWARVLDTINYEIVTGISARVPRIHVNGTPGG